MYSFCAVHIVEGRDIEGVAEAEEESEDSRDFKKNLDSGVDSEEVSYSFYRLLPIGAIRIYQKFISPVKATSCPMYPSCSHYAEEAFNRYNPLKAFIMTSDRLHRCSHDLDNYQKVEVSGFVKFFDPIDLSLDTTSLLMPPTTLSLEESTTITSSTLDIPTDTQIDNSTDTQGEDSQLFRFAQMLESEGDYKQAIIEYRRLIVYFPNSPYRKQAMKSILLCYYKAKKYLSAADWGEELLSRDDMLEEENEINFFIGLSYLKLGNSPLAREYFGKVMVTDKNDLKGKSILLEGFSYAKEEKWEEAEKAFAQIKPDSKFFDNAKQSIELSTQGKKLQKKNPVIAGFLGVIPGLGYLYSGYEQTALASFVVNGLFIWGTVEAFKQHNEGLGIMLGILSFGWYSGNIYGSVFSAQRNNEKSKNDLLIKFNLSFEY